MPGSIFSDWLLQPLIEIALRVLGYWTGRIVTSTFTLGRVRSEASGRDRRPRPRWHGIRCVPDRGWRIDPETTVLIGWLFWIAVGLAAYFVWR